MYLIGIDVSKYKHDCIIFDSVANSYVHFTFDNTQSGFQFFLENFSALDLSREIKVGIESTGHYGFNLKEFLHSNDIDFMEIHPYLLRVFSRSQTLRKTKTDKIDAKLITQFLKTCEYKSYLHKSYHMYFLKSLTRSSHRLTKIRNKYKVFATNVLDCIFPELKPFFKNSISKTLIYLMETYKTPERISRMNSSSYDKLRKVSQGKFSLSQFHQLKNLAKNTIGYSNEYTSIELDTYIELIKTLDSKIAAIDKHIESIINDINPPTLSIPGIGAKTAAVIIAEYGNFNAFSSPAQMLAFAGCDAAYYQSGQSETNGRMVKRGSSYLRYTLMNSISTLILHNQYFSSYYYKKRNEGKTDRVARTHTIRKLLRVIYHLEKNNIEFDITKVS